MAKAIFINAFLKTGGHEGGYVNDPADRGGETYKGIARKYWPLWDGWQLIDYLTKKYSGTELDAKLAANEGLQMSVEEFYLYNFWNRNRCYDFSQEIADELYDTAVNQGAKTAAKYFQQALNKLNRNQKDFPDLIVDGRIGDKTLVAYAKYLITQKWSSRDEFHCTKWLLDLMNYYQCDKYVKISDRDLSQERFVPGWLNRV